MRKFILVLLAAALVFTLTPAIAAAKADFEYAECEIEGDGEPTIAWQIVSYTGTEADVEIPAKVRNKEVVSIGSGAFFNRSDITSITIPDTVIDIQTFAFIGCASLAEIKVSDKNDYFRVEDGVLFDKDMTWLIRYPAAKQGESYTIPSSVRYVDGLAFSGCTKLKSLTVSQNIEVLPPETFIDCTKLSEVNVSKDNSKYSSKSGVLFDKDKATLLYYPTAKNATSYTIPSDVEYIYDSAFEGNKYLKTVKIPSYAYSIGNYAFYACTRLEKVIIPSTVEYIGTGAFSCCSKLKSITVNSKNANYSSKNGVLFDKKKTKLLAYPEGKTATAYTIPSGVSEIGEWAFSGNSKIKSVTITGKVKEIGLGAFSYCEKLKEFKVSTANKSFSVKSGVLFNADKTELVCYPPGKTSSSYTVPSSVEYIEFTAFSAADKLKELTIPKGCEYYGSPSRDTKVKYV